MMNEFGGKEAAKAMITLAIKLRSRATEKLLLDFTGLPPSLLNLMITSGIKLSSGASEWLLLDFTGLPPSILHQLLNELESEKIIYHEEFGTLKLWRMCAAKK